MSSLLDNLPDIDFTQKDTAVIEAEVIDGFVKQKISQNYNLKIGHDSQRNRL